MSRDFTPVQEVLLAAIKVTSLRFQAPEVTLLRRTLDELADRLDEWVVANQPVPEARIEQLASAIRKARVRAYRQSQTTQTYEDRIRELGGERRRV